MRIDNQRRSDNFQDRGRGTGGGRGLGGGGGGIPLNLRGMSIQTIIIIGIVLAGVYFFAPANIRDMVFGGLMGGGATQGAISSSGSVCETQAEACDFSRAVLGSTEDVWRAQFQQGRLPTYNNTQPGAYQDPTLVVFADNVDTACGAAPSSVGPFYCPGDRQLYIDPSFYTTMQQRLNAPGDFAQAYVIAHEVGHHVQNLIGATQVAVRGENQNQTSVRVELQADCFAGVWGHTAQAALSIDDSDLREALNAAHQIGDDTLQRSGQGYTDPNSYTHGTSAQRMRWFRRGFDSGDARQCDTFSVQNYNQL